jgi:hypothetical protein
MAEEIHHPHNLMVRAVLSDLAEATSFLQQHLPQEVSQALNWPTLRLLESFVDEGYARAKADFLTDLSMSLVGLGMALCFTGASVNAGSLDAVSTAEVLLPHLGYELP